MALTDAFYEAVKTGNVRRVRIMMKDSLFVDLTFNDFHAMQTAAASMEGLYDEHDGKAFVTDKALWNDDYMATLMVKVISNFSHERLEHLKDVISHLRPATQCSTPATQRPTNTNTKPSSYHEEKRKCQERGDYLGIKIGFGTIAGATLGGVIASVAGASTAGFVGGIVAGAVVGGVATALIVNGGKK